jgi:glycine/serine hydroxymethyltransferase
MTTRGLQEADMDWVADVLKRVLDFGAGEGKGLTVAQLKIYDFVKNMKEEVAGRCRALRPVPVAAGSRASPNF